MPNTLIRNKIQEVIDQLSLDVATSKHLNIISGNYGLSRPLTGYDDATWRALTKILALQYKQIENKFRDILEILVGPQVTVCTNLAVDVPVGEVELPVISTKGIPQVGTVVLDKGLSTEETLRYIFVDYSSNTLFLETSTTWHHFKSNNDAESVALGCDPGSTEIIVVNSEQFPTTDFPRPLVLSKGFTWEETVSLVGNDTSTNTLSISATEYGHKYPDILPVVTYVRKDYSTSSFSLLVDDVRNLPFNGTLRINGSLVQYTGTDTSDNSIQLKYTIPVAILTGDLVEVLDTKPTATLGSVQILGTDWDIIQAQNHLVEILLPNEQRQEQDLRSASYLHRELDGAHSTELITNADAGATEVETLPVVNWPKAGAIRINSGISTEYVGYSLHGANEIAPDTLAGNFYIPFGIKVDHSIGDTIDEYAPAHTGSSTLAQGDPNQELYVFPGPYMYEPDLFAPKQSISTTLAHNIAIPTALSLSVTAGAGPLALEVENVSTLSGGSYTIQIGSETLTPTAVYYTGDGTVLAANYSAGISTITVTAGASLPNAQRYRVQIGGTNPEIVFVSSRSGNILTLDAGLQFAHSAGDSVTIIKDIITVTQIDQSHVGVVSYADRRPIGTSPFPLGLVSTFDYTNAEIVSPRYSAITLTDGSGFSTDDGVSIIAYGSDEVEAVTYDSRVGNVLTFNSPYTFEKRHTGGDEVFPSEGMSTPNPEGYDYPFRMPLDDFDRINFIIELVRAAGVKVEFISKR